MPKAKNIAQAILEAVFPRNEVDRLLERSAPETLRAAVRAPLPDPKLPVRALFSYDDPLAQRLVLLIKEGRSRGAASSVGALLGEEILSWLGSRAEAGQRSAATVVPVPLSRQSRRDRGYSQTEMLCEGVAAALGPSVAQISFGALRKTRNTPKQASLGRAARLNNLRGAFEASEAEVRGRAVALVDDVATTGATLRACRAALRRAGAASVGMFAVAQA